MEKTEKGYHLENGVTLPWIAFGTGVVWQYSRNIALFLKRNLRQALSSVKHGKMNRQLKGNLRMKQILAEAYDAGFRLFDTGRIYGYSEKYIGEVLSEKSDMVLITKCSAMELTRKCSPHTVAENLTISLGYLKKKQVDLYLLHWPEGDWLNYYREIIEEYRKGRCKAFGACNLQICHLEEIRNAGLPLPMVIQTELHILNQKLDLQKFCKQNGILLMAHTPTTGSYDLMAKEPIMQELMKKYNKSAVQIALRWHYQNDVIPVVSTFTREHMRQDLDIFDFSFTAEEMEQIAKLDKGLIRLKANGVYSDDRNYAYNL